MFVIFGYLLGVSTGKCLLFPTSNQNMRRVAVFYSVAIVCIALVFFSFIWFTMKVPFLTTPVPGLVSAIVGADWLARAKEQGFVDGSTGENSDAYKHMSTNKCDVSATNEANALSFYYKKHCVTDIVGQLWLYVTFGSVALVVLTGIVTSKWKGWEEKYFPEVVENEDDEEDDGGIVGRLKAAVDATIQSLRQSASREKRPSELEEGEGRQEAEEQEQTEVKRENDEVGEEIEMKKTETETKTETGREQREMETRRQMTEQAEEDEIEIEIEAMETKARNELEPELDDVQSRFFFDNWRYLPDILAPLKRRFDRVQRAGRFFELIFLKFPTEDEIRII